MYSGVMMRICGSRVLMSGVPGDVERSFGGGPSGVLGGPLAGGGLLG